MNRKKYFYSKGYKNYVTIDCLPSMEIIYYFEDLMRISRTKTIHDIKSSAIGYKSLLKEYYLRNLHFVGNKNEKLDKFLEELR